MHEQRFVLHDVDWATYRTISNALVGRHLRLAFDGGRLEFAKVSSQRGHCGAVLAGFVTALTEELKMPILGCRDMTCEREDLQRALEPDQCFYFASESLIRKKATIDLAVDPPPDLAVEVDITPSSLNRLAIYAALKVPEVWRFDGQQVTIHQLQPDGQYAVVERSRYFPFVTGADLARFLLQRAEENALIRSFRAWVREQIGRGQ